MEDEKELLKYESNIYIYKALYLIRINLPSSEYIYIIMFLIKYFGLIIFSVSLNENNNGFKGNSKFNLKVFLSKTLITGDSLKILSKYYNEICLIGFIFLFIYILFIITGFVYMKKKYYNKKTVTWIDKKIKNINNDSSFEKKYFKIIAYVFFLIAFFHQYILEYYFFGFVGQIIYLFTDFDLDKKSNFIIDSYALYIKDYFVNLSFSSYLVLFMNLITVVAIFILFIIFMILNSTKSLFINIGFPFYGNKRYLLIKIIIFNESFFYGLINMLAIDIKMRVLLFINCINLFILLVDILLSFYKFCFYPSLFNNISIFFDFFSLISIVIELIINITNSVNNSTKLELEKIIIILTDSLIMTAVFNFQREKKHLKLFSENLFNTSIKIFNPNDIYYYIDTYLKYKNSNYIKKYRIIQAHILSCYKKECPCKILIPNSISSSIFTSFCNDLEKDINYNINDENINNNENNTKLDESNINKNNKSNVKKSKKSLVNISNEEDIQKISNYEGINKEEKVISPNQMLNKRTLTKKEMISGLKEKKSLKSKTITRKDLAIDWTEEKKLKNEHFLIIGEQEIINRINILYQRKNLVILVDYIFLHLHYLIKVKQNFRLALYFVEKYSLYDLKLTFLSKYFLYEIKKYICKSISHLKNNELIKDSNIIKSQKEYLSMKKVISYLAFFTIIKRLLIISCEKILFFYSFCFELHNSLSLQQYTKTKIYPVINAIQELKISVFKLRFMIEKYNNEEKHPIESVELSYLLTNFFKILEGKLSQDISKKIKSILYFKQFHYEQLENEFHNFMMNHPLIIGLTNNDSFKIVYFTNIFLDKLGFTYFDLFNQDFHEKLFPGGKNLAREHEIMMKQFLFFNKNIFAKEKTFIKSKEGFLISIDLKSKIFPNFPDNFYIISNIIFNANNFKESIELSFNDPNKNIINNNRSINIYSFLLNYDFDFFSMTKNFYIEYNLNQIMLRELRLNFCQFFCVDENKLSEKIHEEKSKKYPYLRNRATLKEINKAYSAFENVSIEKIFKLRKDNLLENYFIPPLIIYDKIDKKKLVLKIPEIINVINEIGLDYEWYSKMQYLKERLLNNNNFQIKNDGVSKLTPDKINQSIIIDNRASYSLEQINLESNLIKNQEQFFDVMYSIRKMGSLSYYIVDLYEILYNSPKTHLMKNENNNSIKLIKNSLIQDTDFLIDNKKKNDKLKKFLSIISPTNEDQNKDEISPIKRSAKTRVFFPDSANKKHSSLGRLSITKGLLDNQLEFKSKSRKNVKLNIDIKSDIKSDIYEENSKEEITKEESNNNSSEFKEKNKDQVEKKDAENAEYIKKAKTKKKEYIEEEDSPLISKDKFKEELKKNNKTNKIFVIIISVIILIGIIFNIVKFTSSIKGYEVTMNLLTATIILEMLKLDIYSQGILSITYCINEVENIIDISNIHSVSKIKTESIENNIKLLQEQINIIINNKFSSEFFNILGDQIEISHLNEDWTVDTKKTDLMGEIRSLSYKIHRLSYTNESCNISSAFYLFEELKSKIYTDGLVSKANEIQKILFYFNRNIFGTYNAVFERLSNESTNAIINIWAYYQNNSYFYLISLIIIIFMFLIFYIIKICFDYSYYQLLFLFYFNIDEEQLKLENQIIYLSKTIKEFNSDTIKYFEYIKANPQAISYKKSFNKLNKDSIQNNEDNSIIEQKQIKKRKNSFFKHNDKKNIIDNNNLLNGSMNGSSVLILNKTNNNINLNNNRINNSTPTLNENNIKKNYKEESIDSLLNISKRILPSSLTISLYLIILGEIIYIIFCILNMAFLTSEDTIWKYSIYLSMNICERIPKLMSLFIYSCLTIITNKYDLLKGNPFIDNQSEYLKYFKNNSLYYSEGIMHKYFENKFFGELVRDNYRINYNLDNYLFQEKNNIFTNTKYWENNLRKRGFFCAYAAAGEVMALQKDYNVYELAELINHYGTNCMKDNSGINESGIQSEIIYLQEEIINKYIEFIAYNNSNITLNEARKKFFSSNGIRRTIVDMQLSLLLYYNSITSALKKDFDKKNYNIIKQQIMLSGILFLIYLLIIIGLYFSIMKNEKYKSLFGYFAKISNHI